ncbi:PPC domain-containing protein, partial [Lyngbya sp. CCY1209]|uniref:PPC domain-containing protein n=1 Tax=Lyngbya sp. CCY1209 TaxID=2886103 RepID=UPI002D20B5BD
ISRAIQGGTYYARVYPAFSSGNTNYDLGFGFLSQPSTLTLSPGNSLSTALNIGNLAPRQTVEVTDFVGETDLSDVYQFTVDSSRDVDITLSGVTDSARVELIKDFNNNGQINEGDGDILSTSSRADSDSNATISRAIQGGTYYARVYPAFSSGNTNY